MALRAINAILLFAVIFCFADRQFATAKVLSERFHIRHEGSLRQLHKLHDHADRHNRETSKNRTRIDNDDDIRRNLSMIRRRRHGADDDLLYEMEVKEVQNTSICSYTVEPIEDESGNWMLKNLQHIKCNKVGNKCHHGDKPHCCIQTYKMMDLKFSNNAMQQVKIYTGCVCAYSTLSKLRPSIKYKDY